MRTIRYTVRSKDTLSIIAANASRQYGAAITADQLFAANRGKTQVVAGVSRTLTDRNLIWPGFVLEFSVPGESPAPGPSPAPSPAPAPVETQGEKKGGGGVILAALAGLAYWLFS